MGIVRRYNGKASNNTSRIVDSKVGAMVESLTEGILSPQYPTSSDGPIGVITASKGGEVCCGGGETTQSNAWMPAVFGSVFAGELSAAYTLDEPAQEERWNALRERSPWEVMAWSLLAYDAVEPLNGILGPEEAGQTARSLHEVSLYLPGGAAAAVRAVGPLLEMEQQAEAVNRPIAAALRRGLLVGNPGEPAVLPTDYLEQLMANAQSQDDIERLVYTMRTHHMAGDLAMFESVRADLVNVKYQEDDDAARQIADLFLTVLGSGRACDPDWLNGMLLPYVECSGEQGYLRGPEIVHRAAKLIVSGRLRFQIGEIKTLTMIGEQYNGFDSIYEQQGNKLQAVMSEEVLRRPDNKSLRNLWYDYIYDIAKTALAFWNMFRIAENEYHTQPHTFRGQGDLLFDAYDADRAADLALSFIDPTLVMRHVDKLLIPIRADLRANGHPVPLAELPNAWLDPQPPYTARPSLSSLGVPDSVDVAHRYVENCRIERLWKLWAWELARPDAARNLRRILSKVIDTVRDEATPMGELVTVGS